jgi:hypothetical protein
MSRLYYLLIAAILLSGCGGKSPDDSAIQDGERMYRDGVLPSGGPMTALVGGDIPIVGTQFSCESCHGRSGMGASEGAFVVPPVSAQFLFEPSPQPARPAYDRDSLARLLREGVTPSGRLLSPELMPRYVVEDADVDVLTSYLEVLSAGDSPGVDETTIRFATIVTDSGDAGTGEAVLGVVRRFAEDINRQTRNDGERWDRGYTPESKLPTVFREWAVDEWMLHGSPSTWAHQLEEYYDDAPVFAVVGGVGESTWAPVSEFCEKHKLPCLYPSTDLPYRDDDDFYTVYFSRGLLLEADLIAAHLAESPPQAVAQVYCDPDIMPATTALHRALVDKGLEVDSLAVDCTDSLPEFGSDTAVVLWLERGQLEAMANPMPPGPVYVSSTLLDGELGNITSQGEVYAAHPFRLPGKADPAFMRFEVWARSRDVELTSPRQQAEAYFACLVINDAVKHMGRFRVREFALDMMDHGESMSAYVPAYPRPSFGPGQRYISKGGYVLPIVDGQPDTKDAKWILP